MCEVLNFKGKIRKRLNDRHLDNKKINANIRQRELSLGKKVELKDIKEGMVELYENLDGFFVNKLGFYLSALKINRYGLIEGNLMYISSDYHFSRGELISEKIKRIYH